MPGRAERDLPGGDGAAGGLQPDDPVTNGVDAGDLAVLEEVDAQVVGPAGEPPGDVVVFGDPGPGLIGGAEHRVADVGGDVDDRAELFHLPGVYPFCVDAVEPVGVHPADAVPDVLQAVREVEHPTLGEQDRI